MSMIYVKPAEGRKVLLPRTVEGQTAYPEVPAIGMWVNDDDTFIARRLHHRDLVAADTPAGAPGADQMPQAIAASGAVAPQTEAKPAGKRGAPGSDVA